MVLENQTRYSQHLYSEGDDSVLNVAAVAPDYGEDEWVDGRLVLQKNFEALFERHPELVTFGEDTGKIGGVNQSMEGMQERFGALRVADTGIRECTIAGQGNWPSDARLSSHSGNSIPRLSILCLADFERRCRYSALPLCRWAKSPHYRQDARAST